MEFGGIAILDLTQRMFLSPDQVRFQYIKEGDDEYSLSNIYCTLFVSGLL